MNIGLGIVVFFVSLIALVAEIILYLFLGMGASLASKSSSSLEGLAFFFVGLMILTGALGILYPVCCLIAAVSKNKRVGTRIFLILFGLVFVFYFIIFPMSANISHQNRHESTSVADQASTKISNNQGSLPQKLNIEQEYVKQYLILSNIKVEKGYGQFDVPGYSDAKDAVRGTLKNTGDKIIDFVEITVYFLDLNGKRSGEKTYNIVNTESMFDATSPLKPNYSKDFGYIVNDSAPSGWVRKVEVEVTKIKFHSTKNN